MTSAVSEQGNSSAPASGWRNRIVGHADIAPAELVPNPRNWRSHPPEQQRALAGALGEVGWVAEVLVNRTTGHVVDGHLRIELALARDEPTVPVTYVELSEEEERLVLATPRSAGGDGDRRAGAARRPARWARPGRRRRSGRCSMIWLASTGSTRSAPASSIPTRCRRPGRALRPAGRPVRPRRASAPVRRRDDPADVARLLDGATPTLLATDPPYGVSPRPDLARRRLQRASVPPRPGYLRVDATDGDGATPAPVRAHARTKGHRNTTVSGDTRVDWADAFALVPSLDGRLRLARRRPRRRGRRRTRPRSASRSSARSSGTRASSRWAAAGTTGATSRAGSSAGTGSKARFLGERDQSTIWRAPSPKMIMGGSAEAKVDHPAQKPVAPLRDPDPQPPATRRGGVRPVPGLGHDAHRCRAARPALLRRSRSIPSYVQVAIERWQPFTGPTAERVDG